MGGGGGGSSAPAATPVADISTSPPQFHFGAPPALPTPPPLSAGAGVPPPTGNVGTPGFGIPGLSANGSGFTMSPIMQLISRMGGGTFGMGAGLSPAAGSGQAPLVPGAGEAGLPYLHYMPQYQFSRAPILPGSDPNAPPPAAADPKQTGAAEA